MESKEARLNRLREERIAREKARIEKLRELNLKKYNKTETLSTPTMRPAVSSASIRPSKSDIVNKVIKSTQSVKNNFHVNGTTKRPITVPLSRKSMVIKDLKPKDTNIVKQHSKPTVTDTVKHHSKPTVTDNVKQQSKPTVTDNVKQHSKPTVTDNVIKEVDDKDGSDKVKQVNHDNATQAKKSDAFTKHVTKNFVQANKLTQCKLSKTQELKLKPEENARKSMLLHSSKVSIQKDNQSVLRGNTSRQSVFERLYQPKPVPKKEIKDIEKIQTDANYLKKAIMNSGLIIYKRHTCFESQKPQMPVRRSISAVHFKRIRKSEINNCIHKWASMSGKLDKISLKDLNEDHSVKEDKITSAVKSEKKKVQFQTPVPFNFNTPRPEELQARLQNWLKRRGKSIDSYHHLQCFGIRHLTANVKPLQFDETSKFDDDENKENVPLESDSDNESYNENMNEHDVKENVNVAEDKNKWRHASVVSDSVDFNETQDTTLTSVETPHPQADKLLLGALNDLTELLREGFDWEQCARWLRAIRSRFPSAPDSAAYWECRAALEERRGDLPNSIHCWEEAIAKGTERSVVEANLDQLLDKFMQLKISPNSGQRAPPDHKMIDVKNIFKSTIIRFAVQQAKLRQSTGSEPRKYTCTPVRRSARLSRTRTPLQVCASVKQAALLASPVVFVPNHTLSGTP